MRKCRNPADHWITTFLLLISSVWPNVEEEQQKLFKCWMFLFLQEVLMCGSVGGSPSDHTTELKSVSVYWAKVMVPHYSTEWALSRASGQILIWWFWVLLSCVTDHQLITNHTENYRPRRVHFPFLMSEFEATAQQPVCFCRFWSDCRLWFTLKRQLLYLEGSFSLTWEKLWKLTKESKWQT